MGILKLEAEERLEATTVSNLFIDRYMPRANGEYIKIYLLLLRYFQTPESELSITALADFLECTEKDVQRGLNYWEKEGVVSLHYDEERKLSGVRLKELQKRDGQAEEKKTSYSAEEAMEREIAAAAAVPVRAKPYRETTGVIFSMDKLADDEAFSQLLSIVGAYKKKPLSREDCNIFAYLYETLGMSAELLEYLAETCAENGITNVRAMEKIALEWHERQIETPQQAEAMHTVCRQDMWTIMKAFGRNGRYPTKVEKQLMDKWLIQYGFDVEIIQEACDRMMRQIPDPSFPYADKILTSWKEKNVRTKQDIEKLEQSNRQQREKEKQESVSKGSERKTKAVSRPNRFHNYQQRDTDYDRLVEQNDPLIAGWGE